MLAPFSVKLEGVFIERVPRCTRLSGSRFLTALRFEVFGSSEQLSYLQRCRIRYHFADVSKMVGGCFLFGNNHLGKCR